MIQEVEQTHEEKVTMYMKCTKAELIEMLIESNNILSTYQNSRPLIVSMDMASEEDKQAFCLAMRDGSKESGRMVIIGAGQGPIPDLETGLGDFIPVTPIEKLKLHKRLMLKEEVVKMEQFKPDPQLICEPLIEKLKNFNRNGKTVGKKHTYNKYQRNPVNHNVRGGKFKNQSNK